MVRSNVSAPNGAVEDSLASTQSATEKEEVAEVTPAQLDDLFKELKTLLGTVEKLQKAREDVGDIKPLLLRLLDGEMLSAQELEELKAGVSGLSKLVRLYSDYQSALENAQPARTLLDDVLKS